MGAKKRVPSKTDQPVAPSRETSVSDLGFTITGALEVDFPEGMKKHCKFIFTIIFSLSPLENVCHN